MTIEYQGKTFLTDKDLQVAILGFYPRIDLTNEKLRVFFENQFGRSSLGGNEVVAYSQALVSKGVDLGALQDAIAADLEAGKDLRETIFNKTATGIGRGHSLGGLAGIVIGIHGTKFLDSAITGHCMGRYLATSSRRKETTSDEIAIPCSLANNEELLKEYIKISSDVYEEAVKFKEKFGKLGGVETFNKVIPYNSPADIFFVLPLDTLASLTMEVRRDANNPNGQFLPRELYKLVEMFPQLTESVGMGTMYKQRVEVPRDAYLHYTVFTDPSKPNLAFELEGFEPRIVHSYKNITPGLKKHLTNLRILRATAMNEKDPETLTRKAMDFIYALNETVNGYNEAVRVQIADSLSWRVWSEQKRHATLRQNVESVYTGAERAYERIKELWSTIQEVHFNEGNIFSDEVIKQLERVIVIDNRLKQKPELLEPYVYHTARQLMFYGKMVGEGFEKRDALFIVPKNIRLRTTETYDLINLIDLEFPLRLCKTCEPERYASSWKKRKLLSEAVPEIADFLQPKCSVGYCTEGKPVGPCEHIIGMRDGYTLDFHNLVKEAMLAPARR